jgi:hypothetical protein
MCSNKAESIDWFQIESRLQDISTSRSSHLAIDLSAALANDPPATASSDPVVSLSVHRDIIPSNHPEIFATSRLQGRVMAKLQEIASIQPNISEAEAHRAALSFSAETLSMSATPKREIAFIDRGVKDLATLLAGIRPEVEPILLSNDEPAPRQMARAVQGREGLEAIHVIAHGRPGEVSFSGGH